MPRAVGKVCAGPRRGDDAGAFLAAMLEREQSVISQHRRIRMPKHAKDAALVLREMLPRPAFLPAPVNQADIGRNHRLFRSAFNRLIPTR